MWKFVARGIRETLERRACRTNVYSQSSQDNTKNEIKANVTCQQKFLPPILVTCNKGFCGSTKSAGTEDKENKSDWNTKHTWTEAVGWSSVLTAGWVVCQTLCLHKRQFFDRDNKETSAPVRPQNETLKSRLFNCAGVSQILAQISNLQARHIFPVTNCVGNNNKKSTWQDSKSQWTAEKPFGPITVEEEFKNVADEFANIHKLVLGEHELRHGIKALEEKRYTDALVHFATGAKMSCAGSMFNLGLCYELGIGTVADQSEAAKCYNDAAAYDHADALYNLGVFHAQGRGGLPINIDIARTCFTKAAQLGQAQAKHALDLERTHNMKKVSDVGLIADTCLKDAGLRRNRTTYTRARLTDYALSTSTDHALSASFAKSTREVPEYNEVVEDATQVFLDFLGLRDSSNQASIMRTTNNCVVPC